MRSRRCAARRSATCLDLLIPVYSTVYYILIPSNTVMAATNYYLVLYTDQYLFRHLADTLYFNSDISEHLRPVQVDRVGRRNARDGRAADRGRGA